jgi:hypothetical protein
MDMKDFSKDIAGFKCEKNGKFVFVLERQMAHDTQYKLGSKIPGRGKVVECFGRGQQ